MLVAHRVKTERDGFFTLYGAVVDLPVPFTRLVLIQNFKERKEL